MPCVRHKDTGLLPGKGCPIGIAGKPRPPCPTAAMGRKSSRHAPWERCLLLQPSPTAFPQRSHHCGKHWLHCFKHNAANTPICISLVLKIANYVLEDQRPFWFCLLSCSKLSYALDCSLAEQIKSRISKIAQARST